MTPRIAVVDTEPSELAAFVAASVSDREPAVEVTTAADIESAAELDPDVLVAGPTCRSQGSLATLAGFHEALPAAAIVLAFDRPHVHVRDLIWIGADAIVDPRAPEEVDVAVRRSLDLALARRPTEVVREVVKEVVKVVPAPTPAPQPVHTPGRVLTVCSATGGCGKTFYATNTASFLSRWSGKKVALVDLDLQFGEVTTALQLRVRHTISDALTDDATELRDHIGELVTRHDTGVDVLAAPRQPGEADRVTPAEITRVIEALREQYDFVVVDTPTGLGEPVLAAMDLSEKLFLLASLDLPSVRNLRLFLQTLERLEIPDETISLVLNKAQKGLGVEVDEVQRVFHGGFHSVLPYAAEVPRSVNRGTPVIDSDPDADVSRLLCEGLVDLLDDDARAAFEVTLAERSSGSLFSRLLRRPRRDETPIPTAAGDAAGGALA